MADEFGAGGASGVEPSAPAGSGQVSGGGSEAPTVYDVAEDTLLRGVPGYKEPVKFGELYKRQQADYTRKTQEAARQKAAWEAEHKERLSKVEQQEAYLKNLAATLLAQRTQGQPQGGLLDEIKSLPYIDGQTAYQLISQLQNEGIGGVQRAIKERDAVIQHMYGVVQKLSQQLNGINSSRAEQTFDGKIRAWVKELDLPEEAVDLAKEIYMAYEGDDLDQEFPNMLRTRWEQITNALRARDRQRVESARGARPFPIAGKGGQGVPGKPVGLTGKENAKETADFLWDYIQSMGASDRT